MTERRRRLVCLALLAAITIAVLWRIASGPVRLESDLLSILPRQQSGDVAIHAVRTAGALAAARITFAIEGGHDDERHAAAGTLERALLGTGFYVPLHDDAQATSRWVHANRYALACPDDPQPLESVAAQEVLQEGLAAVFTPMVPLSAERLRQDPFMLTPRLMQCLLPHQAAPGGQSVLIAGRLTRSAYALEVQTEIAAIVSDWRQRHAGQGLRLIRGGSLFFADRAATIAKREIALIGGVSILALILFYALCFRSKASVFQALLTVVVAQLGGCAGVFLLFDQVSFIVFVFGAALTGLVSDYAVHVMAHARHADGTESLYRMVRRPLTVGMLTTALGFAGLMFFDIPLFRQIGVFAICGLAAGWLFALGPLTGFAAAAHQRPSPVFLSRLPRIAGHRHRRTALGLFGLALLIGLALRFASPWVNDDVRSFQQPPSDLVADQSRLSALTGRQPASAFLLSHAPSLAAAREIEYQALAQPALRAQVALAASRFDPSPDRRRVTQQGYQAALIEPHWQTLRRMLGLPDSLKPQARTDNSVPPPDWLRDLSGRHDGRSFLIATLAGPVSPEVRAATASIASDTAAVGLVEPAAMFSRALAEFRVAALAALLLAVTVALLVVILIYRRIDSVLVLVPSVVGLVFSLVTPIVFGYQATVFSILGGFIVMGASIDYSIFLWERHDGDRGWTAAALQIAAATTVLGMGMLIFSQTLPVRSFGLTIALGISVSLMVALAMVPRRAGTGPSR